MDTITNLNRVSAVNGTDDREARQKFWVAAYTRPKSEKKASAELIRFGIETYVPLQKQLRQWSDRKKYMEVAVIPMIIFAHISEDNVKTLKQHPLIISVLTAPGRRTPAHIPAEQIKSLKLMLSQSDTPVSFEKRYFATNEIVRVIRGNLKGLHGEVKAVKNDMTELWIAIDLLGGAVLKINSSELEVLK